jgi:hypothetical protein
MTTAPAVSIPKRLWGLASPRLKIWKVSASAGVGRVEGKAAIATAAALSSSLGRYIGCPFA